MTTSVALCTYNGEKFIRDQLISIINQTCKVNEIVICDDCSTDSTVDVVQQLAREHPHIQFNININEQNLGYKLNFRRAIGLCNNDIIFLSDQDDIWHKDKVKTILDWFEKHPEKDTVFTNAELIDQTGKSFTNKDLFYCWGFDEKAKEYFDDGYAFELFAIQNRATGATMAMKRKSTMFVPELSKFPHDYEIALHSIFRGLLGYIEIPLIKYRNYREQQIGALHRLHDPLPNNIYDTWVEVDWSNILLPPKWQEELDFLKMRASYRFTSPILAIVHYKKYKQYYKKTQSSHPYRYLEFICSDITRPMRRIFNRLKNRFLTHDNT